MHFSILSDLKKTTEVVESLSTTSTRCSVTEITSILQHLINRMRNLHQMIDPYLRTTIKIDTITVTIKTGIGLAGQDPIHTVIDTGVTVTMTHEEVILGPITNLHNAAHHITEAQAHTTTNETPHTADTHYTEVFPGITVDPDHIHHTNTTTKHQQDHLTALTKQAGELPD